MKPYSDDLEGWADIGMLGGILICLGICLAIVELCRLPGRLWRGIK